VKFSRDIEIIGRWSAPVYSWEEQRRQIQNFSAKINGIVRYFPNVFEPYLLNYSLIDKIPDSIWEENYRDNGDAAYY
jgi:hypothetical protein